MTAPAAPVLPARYQVAARLTETHDTVTLRISLFGDFGYHNIYKAYEASHPGITIQEDVQQYPDHHANLAKHLATGAGADDIEAIDVGFIPQFKAQPQNFYDLRKFGAT